MSIHLTLLIVIGIVSIFLGLAVFLSNFRRKENIIFAVFSLVVIFWITSNYLVDNPINDNFALFWNKFNLASSTSMAIVIFLFSIYFPKGNLYSRLTKIIFIAASIIILTLTLFTNLVIQDVEFVSWGTNAVSGPLFSVIIIWSVLCIIGMAANIVIKYRRVDKEQKIQIKYLTFGIIISGAFGLVNSALIPLVTGSYEFAKYSPYGMIFLLIFTAYAITKYHLFNIRVIATELLVLLISLILLTQTFMSKTIFEGVIRGVFFILVAYFGYLLIKSVISEIEKRKEIEMLARKLKRTNANLVTLQNINNKIISTLELKIVAQEIVDSTRNELKYKGAFLVLVDKKKNAIRPLAITGGIISDTIEKYLKKPFNKYSLPYIGNSKNLIQESIKHCEIKTSSSLYDVVKGAIRREAAEKIQYSIGIKSFITAPIVSRGEVIGAIVFASSKKEGEIKNSKKQMVSSVADQAAIAIENARLYETIERANKKLKELDRLKNEFLSIASHQVRTPLSIIRGYISLLRTNKKIGKITKKQDHFLKNINDSNNQLINIINDFLNLSRIEQKRLKLDITKFDPSKEVESIIERLSPDAEHKNIKIIYQKEKTPPINADEPKIIEVITNLIDNAIKYTPEGGTITVKSRKIGRELLISVKDTGIGIPKKFIENLFQKFARAENAIHVQPNGNGVGLFLVKKIVEAHYGRIEVSTKVGKGTKFRIYLNYESGLKPGEEISAQKLSKKGIIRYSDYLTS